MFGVKGENKETLVAIDGAVSKPPFPVQIQTLVRRDFRSRKRGS